MKITQPDDSLHGEEVLLVYVSGNVYVSFRGTLILNASDFEIQLKNGQGGASFQYSQWKSFDTKTRTLSAGFKGIRK